MLRQGDQSTYNDGPRMSTVFFEDYLNKIEHPKRHERNYSSTNVTYENTPQKDTLVKQSIDVKFRRQPIQKFKFRFLTEHNSPIKGVSSENEEQKQTNEYKKNKNKQNANNAEKYCPEVQITRCKGAGQIWVQCVHPEKFTAHPNLVCRAAGYWRQPDYVSGIAKYSVKDLSANEGIFSLPDLMLYRAKATKSDNQVYQNIENRRKAYDGIESSIPLGEYTDMDGISTTRIRLCLQVFLKECRGGQTVLREMGKTFSDIIQDTSAHQELKILRISENVSSVNGGKQIILLCNKIPVQDDRRTDNKIEIRFTGACDEDGMESWEDGGIFETGDVHHQVAITFTTPKYPRAIHHSDHVHVKLSLYKNSTGEYSNILDFIYYIPSYNILAFSKCTKCGMVYGNTSENSNDNENNLLGLVNLPETGRLEGSDKVPSSADNQLTEKDKNVDAQAVSAQNRNNHTFDDMTENFTNIITSSLDNGTELETVDEEFEDLLSGFPINTLLTEVVPRNINNGHQPTKEATKPCYEIQGFSPSSEHLKSLCRQDDSDKKDFCAGNELAEKHQHFKNGSHAAAEGNSRVNYDAVNYLLYPTINPLDTNMLVCNDPWYGHSTNNPLSGTIPLARNREYQTTKGATKRGRERQDPGPSSGTIAAPPRRTSEMETTPDIESDENDTYDVDRLFACIMAHQG